MAEGCIEEEHTSMVMTVMASSLSSAIPTGRSRGIDFGYR
jgi:hypothetical protein